MESHIGPRLATLAELRGMSAAEVARTLGVSRATVPRWFGGSTMTVGQVEAVLGALSATPAERAMVYEPPPVPVESCARNDEAEPATWGVCPTCGEMSIIWAVHEWPESECDGGAL